MKSFDRDVLARLCQYLKVKPGELLVLVDQGDLFDQPEYPSGGGKP
ncbi:MAG: helix-turn-helix transcriptional regulator [Gammaproteobacteria bacterium]|nr:helix-turn-helix transcriptional regulator [Gammaproteobacteria bacterium]